MRLFPVWLINLPIVPMTLLILYCKRQNFRLFLKKQWWDPWLKIILEYDSVLSVKQWRNSDTASSWFVKEKGLLRLCANAFITGFGCRIIITIIMSNLQLTCPSVREGEAGVVILSQLFLNYLLKVGEISCYSSNI